MAVQFIDASSINAKIKSNPNELVRGAESVYFNRMTAAAEKIYHERSDKPVVLLSGPSGSGKTTTALRIAVQLEKKGLKVHTISMDNYFLPNGVGVMPLDENGEIDLESPLRMDIPLFTEHLKKLIDGDGVSMPVFDFITQSRSDFIPVKRGKNEIIIFEGIHALNPIVTGDTADITNCVYVSVRTRIKSGRKILHPSNIRLMRRLNRDKLFRARRLDEVFKMNKSVIRGEELYIMPTKHRADISIDTFLAYEASVYSNMLLSELERTENIMAYRNDYNMLLSMLRELRPLDAGYVPENSLVREFIGGSSFKY